MSNPSVCIMIGAFPPEIGGAELYVEELSKRLVKKGFDVVVLTRYPRNMEGVPKKEFSNGLEVIRISTPNLRFIRFLGFFICAFLEFLKIRNRVDVIYSHHVLSIGFLSVIIGKIFGKPVIIRDGFQPGVFENLLKDPIIGWSLRYTVRRAEVIIANSKALAKIIAEISPRKLLVFPNPVDTKMFKPHLQAKEKLGLNGYFVLLYVGRLIKLKGVDYLLRAVPTLQKDIPNLKVVIIGEGEELPSLTRLSKELKIEDIVSFMGRKKIDDLPLYYSAADIYLQPSVDEGFPNSVLQAMACGVPVVGTTVGGLPEIISEGENGNIVSPKSSEEISKAVIRLYEDEKLRLKMGENARTYVKDTLSWDRHIDELLTLFNLVKA